MPTPALIGLLICDSDAMLEGGRRGGGRRWRNTEERLLDE